MHSERKNGHAAEVKETGFSAGDLTLRTVSRFRSIIYEFYGKHARRFPWRDTRDSYRVLVSEFMLQQTQVERVVDRYGKFLGAFRDLSSLAGARLNEVLREWQGLGYNRRAVSLWKTCREVVDRHHGVLPDSVEVLTTLPGIGHATASALVAFAFGSPAVFIETNIRRVMLCFFFRDRYGVRDREILPVVEATLDESDPRNWYYALMDYGAMLKKDSSSLNPNRRSAHHRSQPPFEGSDRQLRGAILRMLLASPGSSEQRIARSLGVERERLRRVLCRLREEGFLEKNGAKFVIP